MTLMIMMTSMITMNDKKQGVYKHPRMLINTLFYINLLCYNYSEYLALFQNLTIPQGVRWEQHPAKTRPWVPGAAPFTLFINEPAAVAKEIGGQRCFFDLVERFVLTCNSDKNV